MTTWSQSKTTASARSVNTHAVCAHTSSAGQLSLYLVNKDQCNRAAHTQYNDASYRYSGIGFAKLPIVTISTRGISALTNAGAAVACVAAAPIAAVVVRG